MDSSCDKRHANVYHYIQKYEKIIIIADTSIFQLQCYEELWRILSAVFCTDIDPFKGRLRKCAKLAGKISIQKHSGQSVICQLTINKLL